MQSQYISIGFGDKMKRIFSFLLILLTAVVLTSCKPKLALSVADEDKTIALQVGQSATVTPTLTEGFTLEWETDSASVATVTAASNTLSATINAVGVGTAKITVTVVGEDVSAEITVTVTRPDPTSVNITGEGNLALGTTLQLTGAVLPAAALQTLTWTSSDEAIATVSATGLVTAVSAGEVTITATSTEDTTIKDSVDIDVVVPQPTEVTVTGSDAVMINETITLTATVAPQYAVQGVLWEVDDTTVATITSAGVLTGVKGGTVVVTATSLAKTTIKGTKTITVTLPAPTEVTVSGPAEVKLGETGTFTAVVAPALASQEVTWSTSDVAKATIDAATGVLTPVAVGTVNVIATSVALNTIVGQAAVSIVEPDVLVTFDLGGGTWTMSSQDALYPGDPVATIGPAILNETAGGYYVSETEGTYLTHVYINDVNKNMSPSVWQNRAFLNKNDAGFYEVELVVLAGSANANPDLALYEYYIFSHSGYAAGYAAIGALQVGQIITLSGFELSSIAQGELTGGTFNVYAADSTANQTSAYFAKEAALPTPFKAGFTFEGWYANAEFTGDPVTTVSAAATVYAKWSITAVPATGITVEGADLSVGQTSQMTATVAPENCTDKSITWSVSDTNIATIDAAGLLTGVAYGTVTVTATSTAWNTVVGTKEVQVYAVPTGVAYRGPTEFVIGGLGDIYAQVYAASGTEADQMAVTYASSDTNILTVDATTGAVSAVAAGTVTITITSTVDATKVKTQTVDVRDASYVFDTTSLVVTANHVENESLYYNYKTYVVGKNAFTKLADAMVVAAANTTIFMIEGTYADPATIAVDGITLLGNEAVVTGRIAVAANNTGLTIDGLTFTGAGGVDLALAGGVANFTFKNNQAHDYTGIVLNFKNDGTALNSDMVIFNNVFDGGTAAATGRAIRGGNTNNISIVGNSFEGLMGLYMDAIRLEGNNESATAGVGMVGMVLIADNDFVNTGQRSIWIRRYSATSIQILNNHINGAGDQTFGGAIQIENWVSGQTTAITVKYNTIENILGSFGVRLNNATFVGTETWSATINYNKFMNFLAPETSVYDDYVQAYSDAAKGLINADFNYFSEAPTVDTMPFVGSYANVYASEEECEVGMFLDQGDPVYGVPVYDADLETEAKLTSYPTVDTNKTLAGIEWTLKEVLLNPDPNDKTNATEDQGAMMLRFRGANTAYMYTAEFFDGITTLAFDAKYYSSSHSTSVMKVSKMLEGETTWTEVATIPLTDAYVTHFVAINETGLVKVRFDVTVKSANLDNIRFYQSAEIFPDKYYDSIWPVAVNEYVVDATLVGATAGDRVVVEGKSFFVGTTAVAAIADLAGKIIENTTVHFAVGTYAGDIAVGFDGISLLGPNVGVNPNEDTRAAEAVLTGVITLAAQLNDVMISGLKFTENAQVLNTMGPAGTSTVVATNLDGFVFSDNVVESGLAAGNGFLYFKEASSSYSRNIELSNNYFTLVAETTTLASMVTIDNNAGLVITGNVFEDIAVLKALNLYDTTKGVAGNTLISGNAFDTITGNALFVGWVSPLPTTTLKLEVLDNSFSNVTEVAVSIGSMNNSDVLELLHVNFNVFETVKGGISFERVHAGTNALANENRFIDIPSEFYVKDAKTATTPVTLNATDNIYMNEGNAIVPDALKFVGAPDYTTKYVPYNVVFQSNGGSDVSTQIVVKDDKALVPEVPTKAGYTLVGWYSDVDLTTVFDFNTPIIENVTLYAKWELTQFNVTYNLNGGYYRYATQDELKVAFLTDFHTYVGATESLSDFMHGVGLTTGYDGLWINDATYKAKIFAGYRPTAADDTALLFVNDADYYEKWLPFFDMIDRFVKAVNATQYFWDTVDPMNDTSVGLIRIRAYMRGVKPAAYVTDATMAMMPDFSGATYKFTMETAEFALPTTPIKAGFVFAGWYTNPELMGTPVTVVPTGSTADVNVYAAWVPTGSTTLAASFVIGTYDTSVWAGGAGKLVHLDPNGTGGTYWQKVILTETTEAGVYQVSKVTADGIAYTFVTAEDKYSIHAHADAGALYTEVCKLQVGDKVSFGGADLAALVAGAVSVQVTAYR